MSDTQFFCQVCGERIKSFAKYAGIATVIVEWLALLLYYIQMPSYFDGTYPISYFATLPQTKLIFNISYTLAGLFFWIFVKHHLQKYYHVPLKIFAWSMILFVCVALIPFHPDNSASSIIHGTLAWSAAILFVFGMYIMARNSNKKSVYGTSLFAIILSITLIVAYAISPKESRLNFAFEAGSWFVWQIWILWISYYSLSGSL
jgi:hypothetical protein